VCVYVRACHSALFPKTKSKAFFHSVGKKISGIRLLFWLQLLDARCGILLKSSPCSIITKIAQFLLISDTHVELLLYFCRYDGLLQKCCTKEAFSLCNYALPDNWPVRSATCTSLSFKTLLWFQQRVCMCWITQQKLNHNARNGQRKKTVIMHLMFIGPCIIVMVEE